MLSKYGESGPARSDSWMQSLKIVVEPVTLAQTQIALRAFGKYKGRPARLNMGDCFAYALAESKGVGLLFKGNNFAVTDVKQA